ncbi:TPA: hypothetical protein ACTYZB_004857 [Klebsiella variicola]
MKALLHVCASLDEKYVPYTILSLPEGSTEDDLQAAAQQILPSLYGDENQVIVDDEGVCWCKSECWYIEDLRFISDEDAAHLIRILGLSTL